VEIDKVMEEQKAHEVINNAKDEKDLWDREAPKVERSFKALEDEGTYEAT
jgi:hypothetical protein